MPDSYSPDLVLALLALEVATRDMRERQRVYFKIRRSPLGQLPGDSGTRLALEASKRAEKAVDEALAALDKLRAPAPPQSTLPGL